MPGRAIPGNSPHILKGWAMTQTQTTAETPHTFTRQQGEALVELVLSGLGLTAQGLAGRLNARFPNRPKLLAIDVAMELGRRGIELPRSALLTPAAEVGAEVIRPDTALSPVIRERFDLDNSRRLASAHRALAVIDNTVFTPDNRLDLEWGAEALRYWSDPNLGPDEVSELLRPRKAGFGGWGFYLKLEGQDRVVSAWWAWITEQIDIISLSRQARHYFHRCHLTDDELATSWQKRIRLECRENGWDAEPLRSAMPVRVNGSAWPMATVQNVLMDPACSISASLRHAIDRGLMALRTAGKRVAA